ncbi:MAG: BrnT family toxin [Thermodesulfobacteriota bacterium]
MRIEFDPLKNERNIAERGISFESADVFEWETARVIEDTRRNYGERRYRAIGMIMERLHAMVITPRQDGIRVIRLRKANRREKRLYEETTEAGKDRHP